MFICQFATSAYFRTQILSFLESEGRHKADATGVGDGGCEFRLCDPHHPALDDGSFDIKKFCDACF
jgi:hypothetical protein